MTIIGTRSVTAPFRTGSFACPQCSQPRTYHHHRVRRFFTLLGFPVIPLRQLGEYLECDDCRATFTLDLLQDAGEMPAERRLSVHEQAMRHAMVLMMLADGEVDGNELDTVLDILNRFGHHRMSMIDLRVYVNQVRRHPQPLGTYLRRIAPTLNDHGKENLIRCAMAVASADGKIDRAEVEVIREMARTLELSSAHLHAIINTEGAVAA